MTEWDLTPPSLDIGSIWNSFNFNISSATGFAQITGFFFLAIFTFLVFRRRGLRDAGLFSLVSLPLYVSIGWFPTWFKLIAYVIVMLLGVRWYARSTEGI